MIPLRTVLGLMLAGSGLGPFAAGADETVTHPFRGLTLIARSETSPHAVRTHVVRVDLTAPGLAFKLSPPGGRRDAVRQTTLDFLRQEQAQLAINVHFFVPFPTEEIDVDLVGLAASQGKTYSPFEPQPVGPAYVDQSYAIVAYAPAFNLDAANRLTLVRRDPAHADNRHTLPRVVLWNAFSGSAQIVTDGAKTIPAYSGRPGGLRPTQTYSDAHSWYAIRARAPPPA
ncbi:MAG: hypothetical protein Q8N18_18665 [Opitutaceae bacterium]|nr:hypothetical protein [Opitutaceae bacterium]